MGGEEAEEYLLRVGNILKGEICFCLFVLGKGKYHFWSIDFSYNLYFVLMFKML